MKVIAIKSKDRCGKDTTAEIIEQQYLDKGMKVVIIPLSRLLKEYIGSVMGISLTTVDHLKNDNREIEVHGETMYMRDYIIQTAKLIASNFGEEVLISHVTNVLKNKLYDVVIIPDIRFRHEYDLLNIYEKIIVIEIISNLDSCGKNGKTYELDKIPSDYTLINNYVKNDIYRETLKHNIYNLLKHI